MAKRLFFLLLLVAVAAGAYLAVRHRDSTTASSVTTTTTTPLPTMPIKAYFLHDNALVPVVVDVPRAAAVAHASLEALLAGPPAGYETAVPADAKLDQVTLVGSTATASFSGASSLTRTAQAQVVDTLTQFPTIQSVRIDTGTTPVPLPDSTGDPLTRPATAADYADLTAQALIFVQTPTRDSTVTSPVTLSGTAVVFEGTFVVEVRAAGQLLKTETIDASIGAPERGMWSTTLDLPPGPVQLLFYEPSAEDGSHLHATEVDLTVSS